MSKQTGTSLFMLSPLASKYAELYQQILRGIGSYEALGGRIIEEIKLAHDFRQSERVRELSRLLLNIPIKEYQLIAEYYLVWCDCRELNYNFEVMERIIEQTRTYKAKAISTRAAFEIYQGRTEEASYFYQEAIKVALTASEYIHILRAIAILKAQEGFHKSAIKDLENLLPVLHKTEPLVYYDVLNSLAVELGESGRKQEARNIIRHVLASPFAFAYPEWHETAKDLRGSSRSFAVIDPSVNVPRNILLMPVVEHSRVESPSKSDESARVLNMENWKKRMGKKKNGDKAKPENERDMFFRIMEIFSSDKITDAQRFKIWEAAEKIASEPVKPDDPSDNKGDE